MASAILTCFEKLGWLTKLLLPNDSVGLSVGRTSLVGVAFATVSAVQCEERSHELNVASLWLQYMSLTMLCFLMYSNGFGLLRVFVCCCVSLLRLSSFEIPRWAAILPTG